MDADIASRWTWRRLPWTAEVASIGIGYLIYGLLRLRAPHRVEASYLHAQQVLDIERFLRIDWELGANRLIADNAFASSFCSYWYATLHFIVTPVLLAWLWRRRQASYAVLRSGLVLATAGALVVYATWPLAPPRFKMGGTVDTVVEHPVIWAVGHGVSGLVNEFAAMPSLHVGWAVWCALAVCAVFHSPWRYLTWLYPLGTTLVVVATANHYLLDAVGGLVVVVVPLLLCGWRVSHKAAAPVRTETHRTPTSIAA